MSHEMAMPALRRPGWRQRLAGTARRTWRFLESIGHARAAAELQRTAERFAVTDPEIAARLRAIARSGGSTAGG